MEPFDDKYFMKKAFQEAQLAYEKGEVPVGVVVVAKIVLLLVPII